jgi:hypothetical protein
MSITHNREFRGIWIPAEIWLADELNALEKILLVEVNSLDNERGCIAGNDYFAGFLGVTTIRVSQMIKKLKDEKYIYEASFDGRTRTLKSNIKTIIKQSKDDYKPALKEIIKQNEENYKPALKEIINNSNTVNNLSNNPFNNINTASGLSQNENPTVKDSLQVQKPTRDNLSRTEKPKKEIDFPQEFVEFYEGYEGKHPSKQPKTAERVLPKWRNACKTHTNDQILRSVQEYAEYMQVATWRKKKGVIEWLNGGLYETDWIEEKLQEQNKQQKSTNNNNYGKPKPDYLAVQKRYAEAGELQLSTTYRKRRD